MKLLMRYARSPLALLLIAGLAMTGCASNSALPDSADDLGLDAADGVTPGSQQDFALNIGNTVYFDTDSAVIRPDAVATLDKQAAWLVKYSARALTIEGHADERGTREYNLALGARRAAATRDYLVSMGVAMSRMSTISYGKERPVAVCDDVSCWTQNRRAVMVLSGPES